MKITMTLTAPGCPVAGILPQQVADAAASVTETGEVEVYLVWDPPWDMEKMSEEARLALDLF
jgi:metal-sulfur cluster biosynthetic enzyme